ncbi:MAG: iron-sulfur cluster assembly accessory protein [Candidatus Methanoperedens sp.]|nr:iron-sulfur cluster assembly accessory protein [Candidatus Methanoperedens sp.]MCZ7371289.1 iron-sulfur cluster assembly accessory protein [Candidatus Methanoperedens sp.]
MIEITDAAASELKQLLEKEKKSDHGLRIFAAGIGCSGVQYGLTLEKTPKTGDEVQENNGIKLFFSKDIQNEMDELKIDFIDNDYGKGFIIDNPHARCGSGCGSCG